MTSKPSLPPSEALIQGADLGYYSHFPVLARALAMTTGPVLELGCGWGSTPLLATCCEATERDFAFWDNSLDWMSKFSPLSESFYRQCVTDWNETISLCLSISPDAFWSVVFIDCAPGEIRKDLALKLKDHAEFIILHDHEAGPGAAYYYEEIMDRWHYQEVYRLLRPHTLILSDQRPFGLSKFEQGCS